MGTYPIKLLRDEQGTPFVPLVSSDSVQTLEGEKLTKLLDDKLSPEDLVAGQYIELNTEEGKTTISVDLPASVNTINNLTTETSGQGALDAYQGKVLKDSIPDLVDSLDSTDANKALSARQGKILNEKTVPEGGKVGQVLKKSSNNDHELEWGDAADPNAIVGDGSIMSIVELSYAEYKALEAAGELEEDTEYHIPEMGGDPGSGTGGSGLSEADVQYMIDTSLQDIESVPAGGSAGQVLKKSSDEDHALEWGDAADPNAIVGDGSIMKIIELTYNEYLELEKNNALAEDTEYHISDWNENERTYLTVQDIQELINNSTSSLQETLTSTQNELNTLKNSLAAEPLNNVITVVDSSLISLNTHTRLTKSGVMYVFDIGFKSESAFKAKTDYCILQVSPYHYVPKEDASIQGFLRAGNDTPVSFWIHGDGYLDIYPMIDLPAGTYFSGQVSWIRCEEE